MQSLTRGTLIVVWILFLPTIVAFGWGRLRKRHITAIALLNIMLGWTLVGWAAALIWACLDEPQHTVRRKASLSVIGLGHSHVAQPGAENELHQLG